MLDEKQGVGTGSTGRRKPTCEVGSIAARAWPRIAPGLQPGDILVSANGHAVAVDRRLHEIERDTDGKPLDLVYSRNGGQRHDATITPAKRDPDGNGHERWMIGLTLEPRVEITKLPLTQAFAESLPRKQRRAPS